METSRDKVDSNYIRDQMLRFLYNLHATARSMDRQQVGIKELQQRMKAEFGLSQPQVSANLDYLIEQNFVRRIVTPRPFTTKTGTTQSSEKVTYKISKNGIDRLEGDSEFKSTSPFAGINITAVNGLVAVGNNNQQPLVLRQFEPIAAQLGDLALAIRHSALADDTKLTALAQIETINAQLATPEANQTIIRHAWRAIERAVTVGKAAELASKVGEALSHHFNLTLPLN
jgi:hypothetical protein